MKLNLDCLCWIVGTQHQPHWDLSAFIPQIWIPKRTYLVVRMNIRIREYVNLHIFYCGKRCGFLYPKLWNRSRWVLMMLANKKTRNRCTRLIYVVLIVEPCGLTLGMNLKSFTFIFEGYKKLIYQQLWSKIILMRYFLYFVLVNLNVVIK